MEFEVSKDGALFGVFRSPLTGLHNLRNMLGVIAVAHHRGLPAQAIGEGLATFAGMKRRQDVRGVAAGVTVIDDFAHHPTAVRATLQATRDAIPAAHLGDLRAAPPKHAQECLPGRRTRKRFIDAAISSQGPGFPGPARSRLNGITTRAGRSSGRTAVPERCATGVLG